MIWFEYELQKGSKSQSPSAAEIAAEEAQAKELADLQAQEDARTAAMSRSRRGRASLLSGTELGDEELSDTLG